MSEKMESGHENQMEQAVSSVIDQFKQEGKTMLAYNGQYVYGCMEEDIPKGAIDSYTGIDSKNAREWVRESLEQGYSYGDVHSPEKKQ